MGSWEYQKDRYKQISLKLHPVNDRDIIDYLDSVDNVHKYIKDLIRVEKVGKCDGSINTVKDRFNGNEGSEKSI